MARWVSRAANAPGQAGACRSGGAPKGDRLATGISDRHAPEGVIGMDPNTHPLVDVHKRRRNAV